MAPKTSWRLFERLIYEKSLPDGILSQCPRIIPPNDVEICRLVWLPEVKNLLQVETFMKSQEPVINDENNEIKGLQPSKFAALRCDVLDMKGENDEAEKCSSIFAFNNVLH